MIYSTRARIEIMIQSFETFLAEGLWHCQLKIFLSRCPKTYEFEMPDVACAVPDCVLDVAWLDRVPDGEGCGFPT